MIASDLYKYLGLPNASLLDKRIYKKLFHEHAQMTSADKKALSEDVEQILWKYTLKPDTVQVRTYEDEQREYLEMAVIEVDLTNRKRASRIAEIIHRSIPYPVLLVAEDSGRVALSVAHKRFSLAENGAIVAEGLLTTPWIAAPTDTDTAFLASLHFRNLSQMDFYALYQDIVLRVLTYNAAEWTGRFQLSNQPEAAQCEALEQCRELKREINRLKVAIRKESGFAEKVELNTLIKTLENRLVQTIAEL